MRDTNLLSMIKVYQFLNLKFLKVDDNIQFKFKKSDIIVPDSNGVAEWKFEESFWSSKETSCKKVLWKKAKTTNFSNVSIIKEKILI